MTVAQLCTMSRCWPCLILWLTHQPGMSHFQLIVDCWCAYHRLLVNPDSVTMGWKDLRISWDATNALWSAHRWNCVSFQSWLKQFKVSEKNSKLTRMRKTDPFQLICTSSHRWQYLAHQWHILASHSLHSPLITHLYLLTRTSIVSVIALLRTNTTIKYDFVYHSKLVQKFLRVVMTVND